MHALFTQISGFVALLVFFHELWRYSSLDQTILAGIGAGLAVYAVLIIASLSVRHILEARPARLPEATSGADAAGNRDASQHEPGEGSTIPSSTLQ
jgi:hypothetical protein